MLRQILTVITVLGIVIFLPGPGQSDEGDRFLQEARQVVKQFGGELRMHLQKQMQSGGATAAVAVCSKVAPAISSKLSRQTGWSVKRVSLKVRNPMDIPDLWEQRILKKFESDLKSGTPINELEDSEFIQEGEQHYFRYMKAIPTGDLCLLCHGPRENLSPDIQRMLTKEYPHDNATGFQKGMIRGAFSIKRPM